MLSCALGISEGHSSRAAQVLGRKLLTQPSYTKSRMPPPRTLPTIQPCSAHVQEFCVQVWWYLGLCTRRTNAGSRSRKNLPDLDHTLVLASLVFRAHESTVSLNFQ